MFSWQAHEFLGGSLSVDSGFIKHKPRKGKTNVDEMKWRFKRVKYLDTVKTLSPCGV
jgi:hypothetical protein